jgi:hypothetical protein
LTRKQKGKIWRESISVAPDLFVQSLRRGAVVSRSLAGMQSRQRASRIGEVRLEP